MGQFKDIDTILRQIADDTNVHPSIREAMRNATQPNQPTAVQPFAKVYLLMCDGVVTDVFTDKAMAMYDLHVCQMADKEEGLTHNWTVIKRQRTTATLS